MTGATHPARCGRCGVCYTRAAFGALSAVSVLARPDLAGIVVGWPSDLVVDVRACASCATPIARLAPA